MDTMNSKYAPTFVPDWVKNKGAKRFWRGVKSGRKNRNRVKDLMAARLATALLSG